VLFVDLDDFKNVNDTLGHGAGDELLSIVAQRLRSGTRDREFVARLGGDEFAIVVDCGDRPGEALIVAERAIAALNEPIRIGETTSKVSCSIGISTSSAGDGPDAAEELLRNADFAMYIAKSQGKNCFDVFAPSMHADMLARLEFKRDLGRAIELDQLVLHYQPVIDLTAGALKGFEALVRWQHPTRGTLAPGEFIALAEQTGDIIEIGGWVLDQACGDLAALRRDIPGGSMLRMAINVSAHQIVGPSFVDRVKAVLDRHGVPAGAITLEITEAVALTNTEVATESLAELRRYGVLIALDDFGVGYSSLRYLHDLPIDVIKIDRSFVMDRKGDTDSMLEAIVTLGQSLGLEIIAEGIEKPSELERLRRFHDVAGQGYLFARPMPAADAALFVGSNAIAARQSHLDLAASVTG
jgi:diguanylate cyclase (GGDEF)-like protein